jgi:hypothetical protein
MINVRTVGSDSVSVNELPIVGWQNATIAKANGSVEFNGEHCHDLAISESFAVSGIAVRFELDPVLPDKVKADMVGKR